MKITTLSIVIPAYNEAATIHMILNKIKKVELVDNIQKEIIIVNDCSKDNTREAVLRYMKHNPSMNIVFHEHEVNKKVNILMGSHEGLGDLNVVGGSRCRP